MRTTNREKDGRITFADYDAFVKGREKLAELEDAEESGKLVILPVPIGTPVYVIQPACDECSVADCDGSEDTRLLSGHLDPDCVYRVIPVSFVLMLAPYWYSRVFESPDAAYEMLEGVNCRYVK